MKEILFSLAFFFTNGNIKEDNKVLPEYLEKFTTNFWEEF